MSDVTANRSFRSGKFCVVSTFTQKFVIMSVVLSKKLNNSINATTSTTKEDVEAPMAGEENSEPSVDHVPCLAVPSDYFIYVTSLSTLDLLKRRETHFNLGSVPTTSKC